MKLRAIGDVVAFIEDGGQPEYLFSGVTGQSAAASARAA
jgi:hypothetical protein